MKTPDTIMITVVRTLDDGREVYGEVKHDREVFLGLMLLRDFAELVQEDIAGCDKAIELAIERD